MQLFPYYTGEQRLLHVSLEELNKQRAAVGAVAAIPLSKRAAQANASVQNATKPSTGTAVIDPAAASMQRLRQTQEYLNQNPSVDPTGSINAAAREGQTLAQSYVAPVNQGNLDYQAQQAQFLENYTGTKYNASQGFGTQVNYKIDTTEGSPTKGMVIQDGGPQVSSSGVMNQSAINTLRKAGLSEEEILANLTSPARNAAISQTMSNTGLEGGTARKSAVVMDPQKAQSILATSRNPEERKAAQAYIDTQIAGVKGYAPKENIDQFGNKFITYSEDAGAAANNQVIERQRMALEQANRLKTQEQQQKMKEFVAGIDTSAFEMTKNQINEAMGMIKNLSPDLQSAVLPELLNLQESNNRITENALQMQSTLPTDKEIEDQYGSFETYINKMDEKMKTMNEENKRLQLDVADYNKQALEIEKKIIDHDAAVSEQKQIQTNIQNEKMLRRQLNKLGIQTDTVGLDYLNTEIQKGVDALENLKTSNNLVSLKAQLAIGQGYALDVRKAISDYDAKDLQITSQTAEALMKVKQSISTAKSDRDKELRSILKDANDKKDENAKEARTMIYNANIKMIDETNKLRDDERAREQLGINMLDKLVDTYGNNVPPSLLETVKKYIPNIDIQDVVKRRTLAQMKKGAGGTGGITGFSFSQKTPTGKPQTLEQFIETKQKDFNTKMYGPASPEMRKEWEKEYQAKLAIDTANTAEQLMKEWTIKRAGAGNFPNLGTMKAVEADFQNALKSGELEFARQILDGIGARPRDAIAEKLTNTQQLVADLDGMEDLIESIEDNVGAFPTKGKLWTFINENMETTPEYAKLRQYVDTNLAPYARGVSGDRGATSEPDVARAMSSLLDPNVDAPALRAALSQAKKRASTSATLMLKNLRESGYRVNALQESNEKFMNQYQQVPSTIPQSTQDWFNKY